MHVYLVKVHVAGIGMAVEEVRAYTALDAQRLIERRYSPSKVTLYSCRQIS